MFFIPYGTREDQPRQTFPVVNIIFVVINVLVFGFEVYLLATAGESGLNDFLKRYATVPASVTSGHLLQIGLLTSMFLHAGILHIVGNMMYLLPFGDNVEDRLGHFRYILFYLLCGIIATLTYVAFNHSSQAPLLGASGAIAGVLGGYLVLHPRGTVKGFLFIIILLIRVDLPAFIFIGYWFVMQLFSSVAALTTVSNAATTSGGVAFMAHVGGFVAGLALAPLLAATRRRPLATAPPLR